MNPTDTLIPHIDNAIETWLAENTPEKITKDIHKKLEEHKKTILLKLLGFDARYGDGWSLDHCNGRAGNSTAGDYLNQHMNTTIRSFLAQVTMPSLSVSEMNSMAESMRHEYIRYFKQRLHERIQAHANQQAENLIHNVIKPMELDSYVQLKELLNKEA